jgi:hypothetical protein
VFCGPINCTVVTCKHSGECNVLVHKNAARVVGGRRTGQGLRPIRVGGAKASAIDGRSTGPTNPSGPDMPDRPKATSAYHGGATGGPHHH